MAKKRPTVAERQERASRADSEARSAFMPRLAAATTYAGALDLAHESLMPGAVRKYHSNLAFFLQYFRMPAGASALEREAYKQLFERLVTEGSVDLSKDDPRQFW